MNGGNIRLRMTKINVGCLSLASEMDCNIRLLTWLFRLVPRLEMNGNDIRLRMTLKITSEINIRLRMILNAMKCRVFVFKLWDGVWTFMT